MAELRIPVRFHRYKAELGTPIVELGSADDYADMPTDPAQAAFVMVDCWDRHYIETHESRTAEIVERNLVPALQAAREVGMTVVRTPSPPVAARYPLCQKLREQPWWAEVQARVNGPKPSYGAWPWAISSAGPASSRAMHRHRSRVATIGSNASGRT